MGKFVEEIARVNADQNIKSVDLDVLASAVMGSSESAFEVGDCFTLPEDAQLQEQTIAGSQRKAYFFVVETEAGLARRFYPSALAKRRRVWDNGVPTSTFESAWGTAVDAYKAGATVLDGVKALMGKKIVVAAQKDVNTIVYGTTMPTTTTVMQWNFKTEEKDDKKK